MTGSVDQYGNVQAIGGANEKIEGYFRVCKAIGLTGSQGVMLPRANVENLMLDPEIVAAVDQGRFHIYPIDTIDQGIELLTAVRAGALDEPGTINYLVMERLKALSEALRNRATETRIVQEAAPAPPPRVVVATRDDVTDGSQLQALLESEGATVMQATPATWRLLIEAGWSRPGMKMRCAIQPELDAIPCLRPPSSDDSARKISICRKNPAPSQTAAAAMCRKSRTS